MISAGVSPLTGVVSPINAGIAYSLTSGTQTFSIYGRESGTIIDGFVLSDTNLTAAQLDQALSGTLGGSEKVLTVAGNFQQAPGSVFQVEIDGGTALNKMNVTGTAQLAGDLSVSLASGFVPQPASVFSILDASSLSGQFANAPAGMRVPTADRSGSFLVNYDLGQSAVTLSSYAAAIPGDFNFDLSVDGADLAVWQSEYGSTLTSRDFLVWQRNYGASALTASSTAIPEPSTVLLTSLWLLLCPFRR